MPDNPFSMPAPNNPPQGRTFYPTQGNANQGGNNQGRNNGWAGFLGRLPNQQSNQNMGTDNSPQGLPFQQNPVLPMPAMMHNPWTQPSATQNPYSAAPPQDSNPPMNNNMPPVNALHQLDLANLPQGDEQSKQLAQQQMAQQIQQQMAQRAQQQIQNQVMLPPSIPQDNTQGPTDQNQQMGQSMMPSPGIMDFIRKMQMQNMQAPVGSARFNV